MNRAGSEAIRLPGELEKDLVRLGERSAGLRRAGRASVGLASLGVVLSGAALATAYWLAPSATISAVHVPAELLKLFSGVTGLDAGSAPVQSALGRVVTGWLPKVMFIATFLVGVVAAFASGRLKYLLIPAFAAGPLILMPMMLNMHDGSLFSRQSDRDAFAEVAKHLDVQGMENLLKGVDAPPLLRDYVLAQAQAAVAQATKEGWPMVPGARASLIQRVQAIDAAVIERKALPELSAEVLYGLDMAAFNGPRTPTAQRYFDDSSRKAEQASALGRLLLGAASVVGVTGAMLLGLGRRLRLRLDRIRPLLGKRPVAPEDK